MLFCTVADDGQSKPMINVFDALDAIVTRKLTPKSRHKSTQAPLSPPLLMPIAIRYDVSFWVEELLKRGHPTRMSQSGVPFLFIALNNEDILELPKRSLNMPWEWKKREVPSWKCIKALLSYGADPYEQHEGSTAWDYAIDRFATVLHDGSLDSDTYGSFFTIPVVSEWLNIAEMFISRGASASLLHSKIAHLVENIGMEISESRYIEPDDFQRLCQISGVDYGSLKNLPAFQNDEHQSNRKRRRINYDSDP